VTTRDEQIEAAIERLEAGIRARGRLNSAHLGALIVIWCAYAAALVAILVWP